MMARFLLKGRFSAGTGTDIADFNKSRPWNVPHMNEESDVGPEPEVAVHNNYV